MPRLYSYFRSSAAYRVRIVLALKGLAYRIMPAALVPTLQDGDVTVTQSMAIVEYLEETQPQVPLLPADAAGRARVRALAQTGLAKFIR